MVGMGIKPPKERCSDPKCPFHGTLSVRGRTFEGVVVSDKMSRAVTIEMERMQVIPKYERYERRTSKLHAHNPPCITARTGDRVKIMECRRLSKTKSFVVVQKLGA
ncbi:MAG: 30S ribosomal protein S17 [Hadesarchaea archaeon]|nr:MAG: 30S ribosomal protein S17 [Hadesarchaea archaeon]